MNLIIAIDGPAGAGKSTIAREIAKKLNIIYFDSGSIYRTFTYYILEKYSVIDPKENYEKTLDDCSKKIRIDYSHGNSHIYLDGRNISSFLRMEEITRNINKIANNAVYRNLANNLIKEYANNNSIVIDGRDIGTVLFPETPFKFYLDASVEERSKRRYLELKERAKQDSNFQLKSTGFDEIFRDIVKRDQLDKNREVGPLKKAFDAVYINSDNLSIAAVIETIFGIITEKFAQIKAE